MEKVVVLVRSTGADEPWCRRLRDVAADALVGLGFPGVAVNVRDDPVRDAMMTLTTLDPPVAAVVSVWTQQCYGDPITAAVQLLAGEFGSAAAYLVTESVPLPSPDTDTGQRTPGLANVALLRRPAGLDQPTWLHRWQIDHTPVAMATQATFGYTQNAVVRALTPGAPVIDGIVEELFPDTAAHDPHAFYGAVNETDLRERLSRLMASVAAFGADRDIDVVPTSRYVFRDPFAASR